MRNIIKKKPQETLKLWYNNDTTIHIHTQDKHAHTWIKISMSILKLSSLCMQCTRVG